MSAAFTPGPWSSFRNEDSALGYFIDTSLGNDSDNVTVIADRIAGKSALSNARLIAAAPELYEALRELLVAVRFADPPKDYGTPEEPNLCHEARIPTDFVTIAERALAKARGEA